LTGAVVVVVAVGPVDDVDTDADADVATFSCVVAVVDVIGSFDRCYKTFLSLKSTVWHDKLERLTGKYFTHFTLVTWGLYHKTYYGRNLPIP
jgi:hypothetical protein